ncbi:MAG: ABC transporter ATP-binding protein [Actinomycetota bacterium]|nr:ABC transporter ATP-binding protein [Actinomycetota bacterium]
MSDERNDGERADATGPPAPSRDAPPRGMLGNAGMPAAHTDDFASTVRRLIDAMRPERIGATSVVVMALVAVTLTVLGPRALGGATDVVVDGVTSGEGIDFDRLGRTLLGVIAIYAGAVTIAYGQNYVLAGVVQRTMLRLRAEVEAKLHRMPHSYIDRQSRGDLLSRVTNDIDNLQQSLQQGLGQLLTSTLTIIGVVVMMFLISPVLASVAIITIPASLVLIKTIGRRSQKRFIAQWSHTGRLNGQVEETFTGHSLVKVFGRQRDAEREFAETNEKVYEASFKAQFIVGVIQPTMMFLGNLNYVVIAVVGGLRVSSGSMTIGDIQAFIQYSRQFTQPLTQVASMINVLQSGVASAERVFEFLDGPEESPEPAPIDLTPLPVEGAAAALANGGPATNDGVVGNDGVAGNGEAAVHGDATANGAGRRGRVAFEHVSFSYDPENPLIDDLSLVAEPGQTVAIVGPTGAGKTTLVNLIMRFYELDGGRITLDGHDIAAMPRPQLRSNIGMVLQDTWLFGGTIWENIAYGRFGASDEEILAAAKASYVDRFARSLPDGYDTVIDDEGGNISTGEKQLITIARAFLAEPTILILDEATSSVDTRTEVLIQQAMATLRSQRTSFVIAHRLSTIRDADTILVMDGGRIVEQGNHDELMARGEAYYALHNAQFRAPVSDPG